VVGLPALAPPRIVNPVRFVVGVSLALAAAAILLWVLYQIRDALLLVYVSALFAIGFSPLVRWIGRQRVLRVGIRRVPRGVAILIVYLAILGTVGAIAAVVLPPLVRQAREFATDLPRLFAQTQEFLVARGLLREPLTWQEAIQQAPGKSTDAVGAVIAALWGFVGGLVGVLSILILTFYFLVEAEDIFAVFLRLFPRERRPRVAAVSLEIGRKVSAWLGGQLLLGAVIGASAAIGLGVLGVPYFYVLALIAAIGELIPVVGPVLAAVPGIAVAWSVSGRLALVVAIFYVIQQQVENHVLVPKLMERQLGVSASTVIIALLVGSSLLGIVGALLAVPTAAIVQVLVQELWLTDEIVPPADTG
jgi:predicted PurR-regulated permease PerM